jgi:formylglycine-generating enzyme required for sulfatase activity
MGGEAAARRSRVGEGRTGHRWPPLPLGKHLSPRWDQGGQLCRRADENHRNVQFIELIRGYDDGYRYTAPVGTYPAGASPYGVLDMAGNVSEWCDGWYAAYQRSTFGNADFGTTYRVRRGGSYVWGRPSIRTSARDRERSETTSGDNGFRCAVSFED